MLSCWCFNTYSSLYDAKDNVLVLTRGASSTECSRYLAAWEDNCRNGVPTIVIDASSATQHLPQQLEDTSLQWLMGYIKVLKT